MKNLDVKIAIGGIICFWSLVVIGITSQAPHEEHTHDELPQAEEVVEAEVEDIPPPPTEPFPIPEPSPVEVAEPTPHIAKLDASTECRMVYDVFLNTVKGMMAEEGLTLVYDNPISINDGTNIAFSHEMFVSGEYVGQVFGSVEGGGTECLLAADLVNGNTFSDTVKLGE